MQEYFTLGTRRGAKGCAGLDRGQNGAIQRAKQETRGETGGEMRGETGGEMFVIARIKPLWEGVLVLNSTIFLYI